MENLEQGCKKLLGYISGNIPVILLPSIKFPNFTGYSWSLGTTNDEMMSEFLEG